MPLHPTDRRDLAASVLAPHLFEAVARSQGGPAEVRIYRELESHEQQMWAQRAKAVMDFFTDPQSATNPVLQSGSQYFGLAVRLARQQEK